ncbi:MAG: hypothetical protein COA36_09540 [Desulfotalea sp.]|nr:MAG: hypothetical protein COA36_09540 [Desulfotalea sp.]
MLQKECRLNGPTAGKLNEIVRRNGFLSLKQFTLLPVSIATGQRVAQKLSAVQVSSPDYGYTLTSCFNEKIFWYEKNRHLFI